MGAFLPALRKANKDRGFLICGLDPVFEKMPDHLKAKFKNIPLALLTEFLIPIIKTTAPYVAGFKPNLSFFLNFDRPEKEDFAGQIALSRICRYIRVFYPDHLLILDAKDGDIGDSNWGYFKRAFDGYDAHALTWDPYLGFTCQRQMLKYKGRGIIALARTSNQEGTAFQGVECEDGRPVFMQSIDQWHQWWKEGYHIGLVVGATHPEDIRYIRKNVDSMPLLIPGVGTQGGDLERVCAYGFGGKYGNMMINVSSAILYIEKGVDFAMASGSVAKGYAQMMQEAVENR